MNQLFIISTDAWKAATPQEIESICSDLKELGLYALPYPEVDIGVSADLAVKWVNDRTGQPATDPLLGLVDGKAVPPLGSDFLLLYHGVTATGGFKSCEITGGMGRVDATPMEHIALLLARLLISLLATRNVKRTTVHNKLAKFGIGRNRKRAIARYTYVTTISTPQNMEEDSDHPPGVGKPKCPHLRRGHIRRKQHFGPNRQFTRSVWIAPIFVNASEEFTRSRQAYNLSMPAKQLEPTHPGSLEPIS